MARAGKGARNIVVDGVKYRWRAVGDSGFISVSIWPSSPSKRSVHCHLPYDEGDGRGQRVVTARIVRRIVRYAREHGYDPEVEGTPLELGSLESVIDLTDGERARSELNPDD